MHGFDWRMDAFVWIIFYGVSIPVILIWIALATVLHKAPRTILVLGMLIHAFALVWSVLIEHGIPFLLLISVTWLMFYLAYKKRLRKIIAEQDLYAREIKVVQPNTIDK